MHTHGTGTGSGNLGRLKGGNGAAYEMPDWGGGKNH